MDRPATRIDDPITSPTGRWLMLACFVPVLSVIIAACDSQRPIPVAWPESTTGKRVGAVAVTGSRFQWSFRFPGQDGRFGTSDDLVSSRHLHLPQGQVVDLQLTSTDYIYTLSLPGLQLEEIAVPELVHTLRLEAQRNGVYRLLSDPMCAVRFSHDDEMGQVRVEDPGAFQNWLTTLTP
ncbi:MAG: hypothetical protein CMJ65_12435 [Planctomycetaceae bacterium]|jgi:cytochrome c oxidase subunit 2|nr:hypothetical protein [Planctomycetaceae bacterium]MDP7276852.1 hypothetical protein [Planctomycetaceae bacterium]